MLNKSLLSLAVIAAISAAPMDAPSQLRVTALASGEVELMIYGQIGDEFWGGSVSCDTVIEQLRVITASTIRVRINSIGGVVSDGLAIYNALKAHPARIEVVIDGQACSIASLIAMAGDDVIMPANALLMVHSPMNAIFGNAVEMRELADVLDQYSEAMATSYAAKTGKPQAEIVALISDGKDHWYTAAQAVDFGFADRILEETASSYADDQVAATALLGYCASIARAPTRVSAALRRRISTDCTPTLFASISEAAQLAVVANIEDVTMKQNYLNIMANGARPAATVPAVDIPAATVATPAVAAPAVAAPSVAAADSNATALQQAQAALRDRNDRIHAALQDVLEVPGVRAIYEGALRDPTMSVENVLQRALGAQAALAQPANGGGGHVVLIGDQRDRFIAGVTNAVLARAGLERLEANNEHRGIGLHTMIRACLRNAGVSGSDRMEGAQLAQRVFALMGTSDFPLLTANVANKALRAAYDMAPTTWRQWCAVGQVSDFKANSRIQVGSFNSLAEIKPGGEYTYGNLSEEAESIIAITKGKALALTRQLIINDDLGVFINAARMMGFAAARTVNEDVYARLAAATAMSDGGALFNATAVATAGGHANYTSSGTALSVASIIVGEAAMAAQKDKSLRTALNLTPKYLLAPRGKRGIAWELLNSAADPASSNSNKRNFAASLGLELIVDAELDKASATAWYLAADQNIAPVIEVDFLDGVDVPYVDEAVEWDTDAIKHKTRLDYGVQAIEWRGGYKNAGA
jgi:ATP-dependent protease ClpP protease subunit